MKIFFHKIFRKIRFNKNIQCDFHEVKFVVLNKHWRTIQYSPATTTITTHTQSSQAQNELTKHPTGVRLRYDDVPMSQTTPKHSSAEHTKCDGGKKPPKTKESQHFICAKRKVLSRNILYRKTRMAQPIPIFDLKVESNGMAHCLSRISRNIVTVVIIEKWSKPGFSPKWRMNFQLFCLFEFTTEDVLTNNDECINTKCRNRRET